MWRRTVVTAVGAVSFVIAGAACGGDDDAGSGGKSGTDLASADVEVPWQEAVTRAQGSFEGGLASVELDEGRDGLVYTVELVSAEEEYEALIDADGADVLSEETEAIDDDDRAEKTAEIVKVDEVVALDEAMETALGEHDGRVVEWKLEGTSRGPQYQFDIRADGDGEDVEVSVDALSGELLGRDD